MGSKSEANRADENTSGKARGTHSAEVAMDFLKLKDLTYCETWKEE